MNNISNILLALLTKNKFSCAAYALRNSEANWVGNIELLDYKSLPKQFFGGVAEIEATFTYLSERSQPQVFAQGRVRVVLGTFGENMIYGFFLNTDDSPKEFHKRAIILHQEINDQWTNPKGSTSQ